VARRLDRHLVRPLRQTTATSAARLDQRHAIAVHRETTPLAPPPLVAFRLGDQMRMRLKNSSVASHPNPFVAFSSLAPVSSFGLASNRVRKSPNPFSCPTLLCSST
jgi:hypothetical protein